MDKEKFVGVITDALTFEFARATSDGRQPRITSNVDRDFKAPDGSELEMVCRGGWAFILQHYAPNEFYIGLIDGPDHGVTFYGPWSGFAWEVMLPD